VRHLDRAHARRIDPTAAVAPSADHVLWSRLGWPYRPADLTRAVEGPWRIDPVQLDAKADRKAGVLRVNAIHEDEPFSDEVAAAVDGEIADLAEWLGLERG